MNILDEICDKKREHVARRRKEVPQVLLEAQIAKAEKPRGFVDAILSKSPLPIGERARVRGDLVAIIAEIKKASPSQGIIRADFNPAQIAKTYEDNGAACLSVLTDEPYFQGKDEYLAEAKAASNLPALRKDFMVDPYQIYESRALGADGVLLIMAALSDDEALTMHKLAENLGMDVLVEVHDEKELRRALALKPQMIGINNRNLKTLAVDINTSFRLAPMIPDGIIKVAESGISNRDTILKLQDSGFNAFLIGESLMRQSDIGAGLRALLQD